LSADAKAAGSARLKLRSAPQEVLDLRDFGAVGDGLTDDGPALQSALDALAAQGGGTLLVPSGRYSIVTPVEKDFSNISQVIIRGAEPVPVNSTNYGRGLGLSSEFVVRAGEQNRALTLIGAENLLIQDITFIGDQAVETDAQITLFLSEVGNAVVRHSEFYGLGSFVPGGAIVLAHHSNLIVEDSAFLGCATTSGYTTSVIQNLSWRGISVTGTRFIDYGNRPEFYSKTPLAPPYSWISIGNAAPPDATSLRREVVLRDLFLDEGAFIGISCLPTFFSSTYTPINLIFISGIEMNVTNLQASGILFSGVERVFIEKSHLGWSHNADSAISLISVGEAILDQVECVDHAYRIRADSGTGRLTIINSTYEYLDSQAQITEVVNTESLDDDPVQYVRLQYLDKLSHEPDPAAYFYWASRLLRCGQDTACAGQVRNELANYLGDNPPPTFRLSGQVTESDGRAVSNATVTLSGSEDWVAQTDDNGGYSFPNLVTGGSYTVAVARQNYIFNAPSQTITTPTGDRTADFTGMMITYDISGRALTPGGTGIAGATISLSGTQSATTITGGNGEYRFDDVRAEGSYVVTVERANYDFAPETSAIANGLSADLVLNFTGTIHTYTISGSTGLKDVEVTLGGDAVGTTRTDTDGTYSFTVDAEGSYTVSVNKRHYTFTPADYEFTNLVGHKRADFTPKLNTHTISGSTGMQGVTVTLSGDSSGTATTGVDGAYSFTVNAGGNYTVTATKTHYNFTPPSHGLTGLDGNQVVNFSGALKTHTISGNTGLGGVTVTLSGGANATATTGADGKYSFTVNAGGSYTITPAKTHYTFTPASQSFDDLSADKAADFTATLKTHTISGSTGLEGVTVALSGSSGATMTTGANGTYSFTVNAGGNYTVTPSKPDYKFTPASQSFNDLSSNQAANFTGELKLLLLTESNSDLAIALDSVTFMKGPFSVITNLNFSPDQRRRITLFAAHLRLNPGEGVSAVTAEAEDSQHKVYVLTVEYVGKVVNQDWLTQVNVKLPDELANAGDVWISIRVRDEVSNKARIKIVP